MFLGETAKDLFLGADLPNGRPARATECKGGRRPGAEPRAARRASMASTHPLHAVSTLARYRQAGSPCSAALLRPEPRPAGDPFFECRSTAGGWPARL